MRPATRWASRPASSAARVREGSFARIALPGSSSSSPSKRSAVRPSPSARRTSRKAARARNSSAASITSNSARRRANSGATPRPASAIAASGGAGRRSVRPRRLRNAVSPMTGMPSASARSSAAARRPVASGRCLRRPTTNNPAPRVSARASRAPRSARSRTARRRGRLASPPRMTTVLPARRISIDKPDPGGTPPSLAPRNPNGDRRRAWPCAEPPPRACGPCCVRGACERPPRRLRRGCASRHPSD
jgi:hypothetical protein